MTKVITYSFAPANLTFPSTWSYDLPGTLSKSWSSLYSGFPYKARTKEAFDTWANACNFVAVELPDPGTAPGTATSPEVRLYLGPIDQTAADGTNIAAFAYWPTLGGGRASDIVFDSDPMDIMYTSGSYFKSLMIHEIGHGIINRAHNLEPDSVLNGISNSVLGTGDIAAARARFPGATTWSQKVAAGQPLGVVWSIYYASRLAHPDNSGLAFWTNAIKAGTHVPAQLANELLPGTAGYNDADWFWTMFNRVFGRNPAPSDQTFYHARIAAVGRGQVLAELANSAEAGTRRQAFLPSQWW